MKLSIMQKIIKVWQNLYDYILTRRVWSLSKWQCAANCAYYRLKACFTKVSSIAKWGYYCVGTKLIPTVIKILSFLIYNLLYFILKALESEHPNPKSEDDIGFFLKVITYFLRMIGIVIIWTLITMFLIWLIFYLHYIFL